MGVLHGRDVLYSIPKLFMNDIGDICKGLAPQFGMQSPNIVVDVSNVSYKVGKDAQSVSNYLVKCAKIGVEFIPVCDGKRPISKQAKNVRNANREKSRIQSHLLRTEVLTLTHKLKNNSLTDSEKNDIREDVAKKQRSMKSKETQSKNIIQPNFTEKLIEELEQTGAHSRNIAGGSVGKVIVAEFQADAVMMGIVESQKTLMVMTDDADIPIISGDGCIAIKFYTKDGDIELVSTCRGTLDNAYQFLSEATKERTKVMSAKFPIFEEVTDRKLRALMCLYLGCDVYPKGLTGVGAKKLSDMINVKFPKFKEKHQHATLYEYLKNDIKSMKDSVVVLMDAAGEQTSTNDCNKSLPELLRSFVVGTEGRKEWKQRTKLPPKPSELGPVKDKVFMSTARRARLTLRRVDQTMDKSSKGKVGTRVQPQNMPEHANSCACYWPGCSVDESSPPQTMVECKMESCHRKVHPLCQDLAETANEWIHQENQPYCCECHPKQPIPSGACQEDALFSPNYTNVVSLMKSAGCDMDDSQCAGFQLLSCRYVDEFNSTERKLALKNVNKAEKEAKGKWKKLQKLAEHRSTNQTHSQLTNLTKRSHEAISVADDPAEEKEATPDRSSNVGPTITPSPDNRHNLRRRAQPLPITLPPPPPPPKPKRGKYVAAPLTIIIQAWPISVKSLSSRENSQLRNQNGNR